MSQQRFHWRFGFLLLWDAFSITSRKDKSFYLEWTNLSSEYVLQTFKFKWPHISNEQYYWFNQRLNWQTSVLITITGCIYILLVAVTLLFLVPTIFWIPVGWSLISLQTEWRSVSCFHSFRICFQLNWTEMKWIAHTLIDWLQRICAFGSFSTHSLLQQDFFKCSLLELQNVPVRFFHLSFIANNECDFV